MRTSGTTIPGCLACLLLGASPAMAEPVEGTEAAAPTAPLSAAPSPADPAPASGIVQKYCTNIRDAAADARVARQMAALESAREEVASRIAALDRRQAEFEDWLARRNAFMARVQENLVAVYANMRPDAAAGQLAILDTRTAASILANLKPEAAGEILNEMEPHRAAKLVLTIAGPTSPENAEVTQ